mmetsp:Transcript_63087/g.148582  ORF Transcript_63087/g.148582 Transcript_63087/m.148582 type:complete len:778 (-) Transcript_63087:2348-4681(-)
MLLDGVHVALHQALRELQRGLVHLGVEHDLLDHLLQLRLAHLEAFLVQQPPQRFPRLIALTSAQNAVQLRTRDPVPFRHLRLHQHHRPRTLLALPRRASLDLDLLRQRLGHKGLDDVDPAVLLHRVVHALEVCPAPKRLGRQRDGVDLGGADLDDLVFLLGVDLLEQIAGVVAVLELRLLREVAELHRGVEEDDRRAVLAVCLDLLHQRLDKLVLVPRRRDPARLHLVVPVHGRHVDQLLDVILLLDDPPFLLAHRLQRPRHAHHQVEVARQLRVRERPAPDVELEVPGQAVLADVALLVLLQVREQRRVAITDVEGDRILLFVPDLVVLNNILVLDNILGERLHALQQLLHSSVDQEIPSLQHRRDVGVRRPGLDGRHRQRDPGLVDLPDEVRDARMAQRAGWHIRAAVEVLAEEDVDLVDQEHARLSRARALHICCPASAAASCDQRLQLLADVDLLVHLVLADLAQRHVLDVLEDAERLEQELHRRAVALGEVLGVARAVHAALEQREHARCHAEHRRLSFARPDLHQAALQPFACAVHPEEREDRHHLDRVRHEEEGFLVRRVHGFQEALRVVEGPDGKDQGHQLRHRTLHVDGPHHAAWRMADVEAGNDVLDHADQLRLGQAASEQLVDALLVFLVELGVVAAGRARVELVGVQLDVLEHVVDVLALRLLVENLREVPLESIVASDHSLSGGPHSSMPELDGEFADAHGLGRLSRLELLQRRCHNLLAVRSLEQQLLGLAVHAHEHARHAVEVCPKLLDLVRHIHHALQQHV